MSTPLVILTAFIYVYTAYLQLGLDKPGWALMFAAYGVANLGILWEMNR